MSHVNPDHAIVDRIDPIWRLRPENSLPKQIDLEQQWVNCLVRQPRPGAIYCHPRLVLSRQISGNTPAWIYGRTASIDGLPALSSLAVFAAKTLRTRFIPGLPVGMTLRGRRLVGNVLAGDVSPGSLTQLMDEVGRLIREPKPDFILFEDLETTDPLRQALEEMVGKTKGISLHYPAATQPHWWIDFPPVAADYWNHHSGRTWKTLRRKVEKLEHTIRKVTQADQIAAFLEKAHRISQESWQSKRLGLRIKNNAQELALYMALAELGAMRSYVLEHAGQPIAFVLGIQWQGCYAWEEVGHMAAYSEQSPGTVLFMRTLQDLIAEDTPRLFDFGYGDGEHKRLFGTRQTLSGPVLLVRQSLRPRAAFLLDRLQKSLTQNARAGFKRLGVFASLRKLYRR